MREELLRLVHDRLLECPSLREELGDIAALTWTEQHGSIHAQHGQHLRLSVGPTGENGKYELLAEVIGRPFKSVKKVPL